MPSFPYVTEKFGGGFTVRPKVPTVVSRDGVSIDSMGLVDSGSDVTIIPRWMAKSLALDAGGKKTDILGVGESLLMSSDFASVEVGGARLLGARVFFPSEEMSESDEVVLGTDPLFREFNVTFEFNAKRIILNKVRH